MTERQKIILAIVSALAVVGLLVALLLPSRNVNKNLDFFIQDSNANSQLEVNEPLKFTINDSAAVVDKRVLWKMGNGDSIVGKPNISYVYKQAGKYLITLQVDGKVVTEKTIDIVKITKDTVAVDSIPKIVGPTQGYAGERLVFSAEGDGMTSWLWEFGESGTIDAFERQVVYKYDEPGKYLIKLKTNTTLYPVSHVITILPKVEDIIENPADELISQNLSLLIHWLWYRMVSRSIYKLLPMRVQEIRKHSMHIVISLSITISAVMVIKSLYTSMASVIMYSQTIVKDYISSRVIVTDV